MAPLPGKVLLTHCEFSDVIKPLQAADILTYYQTLRSYVEHEDSLIHSRLSWSSTVHGFLFAVYGVLWNKASTLFLELHKPLPIEGAALAAAQNLDAGMAQVILFLFLAQVLVAALGIAVGRHSRQGILAAHRAIQHLDAIAELSPALNPSPSESRVAGPVRAGLNRVPWPAGHSLQPGSRVLVYGTSNAADDPDELQEEVVRIRALTSDGFDASFRYAYAAPQLTPLHSALLPRITRDGAERSKTDSARNYYLILPQGAMFIWIALAVFSTVCLMVAASFPAILH